MGFKGPQHNYINLVLTPTTYSDDWIESSDSGYRVHFSDIDQGSIVNQRTMMLPYTATGMKNSGFHVEFDFTESDNIFRVQKLK